MIRSRASILTDIVQIKSDLNSLKAQLDYYPWDSDEPLVTIFKEDFIKVIGKTISGEVTLVQLEDWATILEIREDVAFEVRQMEDLIFEMANPGLHSELNIGRLRRC